MLVGANIRAARETKRMSQQDVAAALGTSVSRVSGWERGRHLPKRSQHAPLAALLFDGDELAMFQSERVAA